MSKKVLFIVGSLREGSFNHQMALEAEKALAGKAEVSYLDYSAIPLFNQELEVPTLPTVAAAREAVLAADAIWIFSPVYNFSIPGTVKNVTVSSVANAGHEQLFAVYKDLLPFIRTQIVGEFTASRINDSAWADGKLVLEDSVAASLKQQAEDLLQAIQ